jgi:hypothetical protein
MQTWNWSPVLASGKLGSNVPSIGWDRFACRHDRSLYVRVLVFGVSEGKGFSQDLISTDSGIGALAQ